MEECRMLNGVEQCDCRQTFVQQRCIPATMCWMRCRNTSLLNECLRLK